MTTARMFTPHQPPYPQKGWLVQYMQQLKYLTDKSHIYYGKYQTDKSHICFGVIHALAMLVLSGGLKCLEEQARKVEATVKIGAPKLGARHFDYDTLAFIQTVELFSMPDVYSAGLLNLPIALIQPKGMWFAMPFMLPKKLDKQSEDPAERVKTAHLKTGAYAMSGLTNYFEQLGHCIRAAKLDSLHPVTMVLSHTKHCIMVVYENNQWHLIDESAWEIDNPSSLVRVFESDEQMAKGVYEAFGSSPVTVFNCKAHATHHAYPAMRTMFETFEKDPLHAAAYIPETNKFGASVLHVAALYGDYPAFTAAIKVGADVNQFDPRGQTPLLIAANAGDVEMARELIAHGAEINMATPEHGQTALIIAAWSGHADMVAFLLENGANEQCVNSDNRTAYDYVDKYLDELPEEHPAKKQCEKILDLLTKPAWAVDRL